MPRVRSLPIDAKTYQRHALHADDVVWVEKNCYIDVWIELVHAAGCDPYAMLPFCAAIDFEVDQWTFFKPKHEELFELYGIDVQELNLWRPLADHVAVHVGAGKLVAVEADAWWLPDTAGTDYRAQHTKTTIIINDFDLEDKRLGYFHNASYHALEGEDFDKTFRVGVPTDPAFMPFYAEVARMDRLVKRPKEELVALAKVHLAKHLARRPATNPVTRFGEALAGDLARLQAEGLPVYHAWAFATLRQLGAATELLAQHLRWRGDDVAVAAAEDLHAVSAGAKTLILKGARAVNSKKPLDATALFTDMSAAYDRAMQRLAAG
ncbi:MAG: DUF1839 family protein [Labilithrix sp.]|nr:DUF1839 family protein [Labilithrix sp.]MCW5811250.1 DUF1839 family protein [Labilithrix sp.]